MTWLLVALGAALAAPLRYVAGHLLDGALPWGTVLVNLLGSLLLGLVTGAGWSGPALDLLGTGFCGALTTYSAFAVQAHARGLRRGGATVALTVLPALSLCYLGFWLGGHA